MKYRIGFVSNSSSASFVVQLKNITLEQADKIFRNEYFGKKYKMAYPGGWKITIERGLLEGTTSMDNFDMSAFMEKIGVDTGKVYWYDDDNNWGCAKEPKKCTDKCEQCQWRFFCNTT